MFIPEKHNFEKFSKKVWLSTPTMYPDSMDYAMEAYRTESDRTKALVAEIGPTYHPNIPVK